MMTQHNLAHDAGEVAEIGDADEGAANSAAPFAASSPGASRRPRFAGEVKE